MDEDREVQEELHNRTSAEPGSAKGYEAFGASPAAGTRTSQDAGTRTSQDARVSSSPDYCEPILGWRAWHAVERHDDVYLVSLFHRVRWPWLEPLVGSCHAWCPLWRRKRRRHSSPDVDCECGIHAASLQTASTYVTTTPDRIQWPHTTAWPVIGEVALWGRVVECTAGWRGSLAYPKRLYVAVTGDRRARTAPRVAKHLERYGVPVGVIDGSEPEDLATALGPLHRWSDSPSLPLRENG